MMRFLVPIITASLSIAIVAHERAEAQSVDVQTPSGDAELILLDRSPGEAVIQLEYVCSELGWRVMPRSAPSSVSCDLPSRERTSVFTNNSTTGVLALENWMSVPITKVVRFDIEEVPQGVHVLARAERRIPHASRGARHNVDPFEGQDIINGLINIIALAGNTAFVPGTSFGSIGYLGFRSDRYAEIEHEGRTRTAIQVGEVEIGSPAQQAGLRGGDLIVSMNGRYFDDYDDVSRFLRRLDPGEAVEMQVERSGSDGWIGVSMVATQAPQIAAR